MTLLSFKMDVYLMWSRAKTQTCTIVHAERRTVKISTFSFHINVSRLLFGPGPKILAKQVRGSRASAGLQIKWRRVVK